MPTSWYHAVSALMERVMMERPQSILDIGIGFGKYGVLLREALDIPYERYERSQWAARIDGIEAFERYRNPLHDYIYNKIYYRPVGEVIDELDNYDVILLIDVLEHFHKEEGMELLQKLLSHTNKALIISTPIDPSPQEEYIGNTYEAHLSRWTPADFSAFESDFVIMPIYDNKALMVKLYPTSAQREINAGLRRRDEELLRLVENAGERKEKLHIAYALPHRDLTGGLKMLVEQMRWLKSRGHTVDAYLRDFGGDTSALPDWMPVEVDSDVVIRNGGAFHSHIKPCDVIVAGWYEQLPDLIMTGMPVMYWEQGSEPFFGDYRGGIYTSAARMSARSIYSMPVALTGVSDYVSGALESRYNRKAAVIPNGVDINLYYPAKGNEGEPVILLVGSPYLPFKAFPVALAALKGLWQTGRRFRVKWICQFPPDTRGLPFPVEILHNPKQEKLPDIYASCDILLFASRYEGFGMPPLEGMAAGLAVVCTNCGGTQLYAKDGYNALTVEPEDTSQMTDALIKLYDDGELRKSLGENARKTAEGFSIDKSFSVLENVLYAIKERSKA